MSDSKLKSEQVTLNEHLSALLDDEVGNFEQRRVLDELKTNDDLSKKLSSYSLIGESMRSGASQTVVSSSFLAGIHDEINTEPRYHELHVVDSSENEQSAKSSWLRPVGGFAMAASVAAIAVLGFQNYQQDTDPLSQQVEVIVQEASTQPKQQLTVAEMKSAIVVPASALVAANDKKNATITMNVTKYHSADAITRSFLKPYVDRHMQHASTTAFAPSIRVIAYAGH